jgi:hypothetical protein
MVSVGFAYWGLFKGRGEIMIHFEADRVILPVV